MCHIAVSCTLSSVGYGDIAPATPLGRVAVCGLCLVGMGAFGALTEAFGKWRAHAPGLAGGDGLLAAAATLAALLTIGTPLFMSVARVIVPVFCCFLQILTSTTSLLYESKPRCNMRC